MQSTITKEKTDTKCYHCGEQCSSEKIHIDEKRFCCDGCKLVYEILSDNNLCKYYDLTKTPGINAKGKFSSEKYSYLDDLKVKQKLIAFTDGKQTNIV